MIEKMTLTTAWKTRGGGGRWRMGKKEQEISSGTAAVAQLKVDKAGVVAVNLEGREGQQEGSVRDLWVICVQLRLAHLGLGVLFF